jgi:peptidoglycan/xylan/chitin deacetylase (PgdA/CDA1 family)
MTSHRLVNICFHGIGRPSRELEPDEDRYWISADLLDEILDYAMSNPRIQLSFDDGNASDVEIALPALRARGLRGAFFPLAGRIGQLGSIGGAGLRELVEHGMQVGSHGMRHVRWRGLNDVELDDELIKAREIIASEARAPVTAAACPLGSYDRRVLARLRALRYTRVFTSDRSQAKAAAWLQPRYSVRSTDGVANVQAIAEQPRPLRTHVMSTARTTVKRWR